MTRLSILGAAVPLLAASAIVRAVGIAPDPQEPTEGDLARIAAAQAKRERKAAKRATPSRAERGEGR